jgi:hypothetical protein
VIVVSFDLVSFAGVFLLLFAMFHSNIKSLLLQTVK